MITNVRRRALGYFTSTGVWSTPDEPAPPEVIFLRALGIGYLILTVVGTGTTRPRPSLSGDGLLVFVAVVVLSLCIVIANPRSGVRSQTRITALAALILAAIVLAAVQPNGIWEVTPYYVAVVAAMRLERRTAVWMLGLSILPLGVVAGFENHWGSALSNVIGAVPWFLVMRQMRRMREQNIALEASQAAEARAAAAAERGRLAREMHDVLAHTLSALALQLESTRLLAHDRGVDADVSRAIDQAHGLAAGGLDEARRAISTARGDPLPGPERLDSLAEVFTEQSGLPVAVDVAGEPRQLSAEARLAVYRTAQEALTNIRRHAAPERVELRLAYRDDAIELVIEDHGPPGSQIAVAAGEDRTGPPEIAAGQEVGAFADRAGVDTRRVTPDGVAPAMTLPGPGYGLTGMRERAELAGGRLVAEPTGDGFRVELWLPA
jgi:signal transduction histidine kinase